MGEIKDIVESLAVDVKSTLIAILLVVCGFLSVRLLNEMDNKLSIDIAATKRCTDYYEPKLKDYGVTITQLQGEVKSMQRELLNLIILKNEKK